MESGRAFFDADDPTLESAQRLGGFEGTRKYDLHGVSDHVTIGGHDLSPSEFAEVVRADPNWNGEPLTLFSCDTGKAGPNGKPPFAQRLSDELGVPVSAPTELAWANGEPFSSSGREGAFGNLVPTDPPDGQFLTFAPQGADGVGPDPTPADLRPTSGPDEKVGDWQRATCEDR